MRSTAPRNDELETTEEHCDAQLDREFRIAERVSAALAAGNEVWLQTTPTTTNHANYEMWRLGTLDMQSRTWSSYPDGEERFSLNPNGMLLERIRPEDLRESLEPGQEILVRHRMPGERRIQGVPDESFTQAGAHFRHGVFNGFEGQTLNTTCSLTGVPDSDHDIAFLLRDFTRERADMYKVLGRS